MEKKNVKGLVIAFIISLIVIICLVGFICYDKGIIFSSNTKTGKKQNTNKVEQKEENSSKNNFNSENLVIRSDKCLNCENSNNHYYLVSSYDHIDEVKAYFSSNDNKTGVVLIDIDEYNKKAVSNYSLSNTVLKYKFQKEIRNVIVSNIGQEELAPIVVFLMNDGTLNYVDIYSGLENNNLSNYKEINNINNIIALYQVANCSEEYCNYNTILAQTIDGNFYDLMKVVYSQEKKP